MTLRKAEEQEGRVGSAQVRQAGGIGDQTEVDTAGTDGVWSISMKMKLDPLSRVQTFDLREPELARHAPDAAPLSNCTSLTDDICVPYVSRSRFCGQVASSSVLQTEVPEILPLAVLGPLLSALTKEAGGTCLDEQDRRK